MANVLEDLSKELDAIKFLQKAISLKDKYKFAEIGSSLAYYLKSFSNINKLLDYICLIFKHIFSEKIILIIDGGEIYLKNLKTQILKVLQIHNKVYFLSI